MSCGISTTSRPREESTRFANAIPAAHASLGEPNSIRVLEQTSVTSIKISAAMFASIIGRVEKEASLREARNASRATSTRCPQYGDHKAAQLALPEGKRRNS